MSEIIDIFEATDGTDVTVISDIGERFTFHFIEKPEDIQAAVDFLILSRSQPIPEIQEEDPIIIDISGNFQSIVKMNYCSGGITWLFPFIFNQLPTISASVILKNLTDSIFPITVKIISLKVYKVVIKAYKSALDINEDIVFSECDTDDVVIHITATTSSGVI